MSCAGYGFLPKSAAFFRFSSARTPSCIRKSAPKTRASAGAFCTAGKSESRKAENKENRARGAGRRLHPAPLCCHKKRTEVSLDALLRLFAVCHVSCGSFFHNPASALFFADFSQRRNPLRFGNSVCCSERSLRSDITSCGLCRLFDCSNRFEGQVGIVLLSVNQHIAAYLVVIGDAALEALAVDVIAR